MNLENIIEVYYETTSYKYGWLFYLFLTSIFGIFTFIVNRELKLKNETPLLNKHDFQKLFYKKYGIFTSLAAIYVGIGSVVLTMLHFNYNFNEKPIAQKKWEEKYILNNSDLLTKEKFKINNEGTISVNGENNYSFLYKKENQLKSFYGTVDKLSYSKLGYNYVEFTKLNKSLIKDDYEKGDILKIELFIVDDYNLKSLE